jgi:hypothetical protein
VSLLLLLLLGLACLPSPESVAERRARFDRTALRATVILDRAPPLTEVGAVFDGRIELLGYTSEPVSPARGDEVELCFYWRARRPIPEDYLVFVHADAAGGQARRLFADHLPAGGRYPSGLWRPGEVIADRFRLSIPRDYGPPRIQVMTGLYLGDYRLPLSEPGRAPADRENRSRALEIALSH